MRKIIYFALVLLLIAVAVSCNLNGKGDERYITFDSNGGTGEMPRQLFMVGVSQKISSNAFTKEGCRFKNWNTSSDNTGTSYNNGDSYTFEGTEQGFTLYANWTAADTYTVQFIDPLDPDRYMDQDVKVGKITQITSAEELGLIGAHKGYELEGKNGVWNTKADGTGQGFSDGGYIDKDLAKAGETVKLYAQWKGKVTYDRNGGEYTKKGEDVPDTDIYLNNQSEVASNTKEDGTDYYTYNGGTFVGWTTLPNNRIDGKFYFADQVVKKGFSTNVTLYAYWQYYYTSFTVDKETVIQHRQQNTVMDPEILRNCRYIIISSGNLYTDESLFDEYCITEKYGMGEYSYVIKDYKVQELKDKGKGETYYKDNPDVRVIILYTIPSGPWYSILPSKGLLQRLGNAVGSGNARIDEKLFTILSGDATAKSWSGSEGTDNTKGWMLEFNPTALFCWTEQSKEVFATRYQTAMF